MSDGAYDVVIVGAGIAGSILARELGNAGKKVLVLESGSDQAAGKGQSQDSSEPVLNRRAQYLKSFYSQSEKVPESPYPPNIDSDPATQAVPRPTTNATLQNNLSPGYPNKVSNDGYMFQPSKSYLLQKGPLPFLSTSERLVGGTTWHWLGTSLRLLENDFKMRSRYGVAEDWPLAADDLIKDYNRAEAEIGVAADAEGQTKDLRSVGLKYDENYKYPMKRVLPSLVDQKVADGVDGKIFDGFDGLTTKVTNTPAGRNSQPYDERPACAGNTNCIPICPVQAKYDATRTLNKALDTKNVRVQARCVAHKVNVDNNGRITSISYKVWTEENGRPIICRSGTARGKIFVLAAHALETPRLLLMSKDESRGALAHGVANYSSGLVGCNLMDHPLYLTWALAPESIWGYRGPLSTSGIETLRDGPFRGDRAAWRVEIGNEGWNFSTGDPWTSTQDMINGKNNGQLNPEEKRFFGDELVRKLNHDFSRQWRMAFLVEQSPETSNRITLDYEVKDGLHLPRPVVSYNLSDYTKLGFVFAEIFARHVYKATNSRSYVQNPARVLNGNKVSVPNPSFFDMQPEWRHFFSNLPPELKAKELTNLDDPDGIPKGFQYFGAGHIMGTCIMGSSPSESVVNKNLRTWDHDNLYIVGSAVFPTATTANPTLTIAALAYRAAQDIVKNLGS